MMTQTSSDATRTEAEQRGNAPRGVSVVRSAEAQRAKYGVKTAEGLRGLLRESDAAADTLIRHLRAAT